MTEPAAAATDPIDALLRSYWVPTSAPVAMRTDDIDFLDERTGWAVNGNGQILKTEDGGDHWTEQAHLPDLWLRCVGFANATTGWVGTVGGKGDAGAPQPADRLFMTKDGGATWTRVALPDGPPGRICGMCVVNASTIYLSGTNNPAEPTGIMKSTDGGASWTSIPLGAHASLLVDVLFTTPEEGWVVGGIDAVAVPGRTPVRDDIVPVVLHTTDGGQSWTNAIGNPQLMTQFPRGEWGWKIQFLAPSTLLVALENLRDGAILRSDDNGATWVRLKLNDRQRNSNLEGIGFLTPEIGWAGGWGDMTGGGGFTSATEDGGLNWTDSNETGYRLNRFRFIGDPVRVAFASGDTVYRLAPGQAKPAPRTQPGTPSKTGPFEIPVTVPAGAERLAVTVWDRFGHLVRTLADEPAPKAGSETLTWDLKDDAGERVKPGAFMIRTMIGGRSTGLVVYVEAEPGGPEIPTPTPGIAPPAPGGPTPGTGTPGFAADIKPLFRAFDREAMLSSFDLWDYAAVKAHAAAIASAVAAGTMPCDQKWTAAQVETFKAWIAAGMPA